MTTENAINNSFEILNMFERIREDKTLCLYTRWGGKVYCKTIYDQRPGKCKTYTKKEIAEYVLRLFQNKTVFEGR